jgi:hypothetical protein
MTASSRISSRSNSAWFGMRRVTGVANWYAVPVFEQLQRFLERLGDLVGVERSGLGPLGDLCRSLRMRTCSAAASTLRQRDRGS